MAQTRKRAREERDAARRAEVAAAAARREKAQRRQELRDKIALPRPRRRRRYGALPARTLAQLVAVFLAVQVVVWFFFDGTGRRFTLAVLTLAVLLVLVTTRRSTPR